MTKSENKQPPAYTIHDGNDYSDADSLNEKEQNSCLSCLKDNTFMILILLGVCIGFGIGLGVKVLQPSQAAITWIAMPGTIYINLLQLTILPLIASNLIVVIASLDPKEHGLSSIISLAYIVVFNTLGAAVGTGLALLIKPGQNMAGSNEGIVDPSLNLNTSDVFADLVRNMFPNNIVAMCIQQSKTKYVVNNEGVIVAEQSSIPSTNLIGVLLVSIAFGLATKAVGENGTAFLDFFKAIAFVTLKLVRFFLLLTPVGVCFMIAGALLGVDNLGDTFASLAYFILTVTVGLGIVFIISLILHVLVTFQNPFSFLKHCIKSWFISFATTSPVVALPEMFQGCDDYGIDESISRFTCPLASAMKADGPAVFIASAAIFIAQTQEEVQITAGVAVVIWLLTSVSVLAIPHIPSASIIITMTILTSAGVPINNTSYLYAIDWLLDRMRAGLCTLTAMYLNALSDHVRKRKHQKMQSKPLDYDITIL